MSRVWYEVRVRELVSPNHWVKKSKFYQVARPEDAVKKYLKRSKVPHSIMWCEKDRRHLPDRFALQALDLFSDICRERRWQAKLPIEDVPSELLDIAHIRESERNKVLKRRSYEHREKEATY